MISEETIGLSVGTSTAAGMWMLTRFGRACADWLVDEAAKAEQTD